MANSAVCFSETVLGFFKIISSNKHSSVLREAENVHHHYDKKKIVLCVCCLLLLFLPCGNKRKAVKGQWRNFTVQRENHTVCKEFGCWFGVYFFSESTFKCRYFSFQKTPEKFKLKHILLSSLVGTPTDSYTLANSLLWSLAHLTQINQLV